MPKHFLLPHRRRTHVQWFVRVLVFTCLLSLALCLPLVAGATPLTVIGDPGAAGTGGSDGADGTDYTNTNNGVSFDSITVTGGSGGNGGGGHRGGKGGNVTQTLDATTVSTGSITVTGGTGGNTGSGNAGDNGGDAKLTFSAGTTVTSTGAVTVISGTDGAAGSWSGTPRLEVLGTLIAPSITLDKTLNNSAAYISIETLDVSTVNTSLKTIGTTLYMAELVITDANLASGRQLSLAGGKMVIKNLNVTGSGRLFVASDVTPLLCNLNADNANLTFVLPETLSAGDTYLTVAKDAGVNGIANLTGTTIGLDYHTVRPSLAVGEQFTLLHAEASLNTDITTLTVTTPNGDVYTLNVSGQDLLAILSSISPTGPAYARLKAYAEGRAGGMAFVNQGADLLMGQGFGSALSSTAGSGPGFGAFSGFSGGSSRYKTGSMWMWMGPPCWQGSPGAMTSAAATLAAV